MPRAFEEGSSEAAGRGLFVTENLDAGSFVFQSEGPFVAVLDSPVLTKACSWCFVFVEETAFDDEVTVSACKGCKIVRYCGKTCQTASWKHSHKYECKVFKALYPQVLPNTARMIVQILLRKKHNVISQDDWNQFIKLQHHMNDLERGNREGNQYHQQTLQNVQLIARAGKEYTASGEDLGFIESLVGRLITNTMTLTSPIFTPLGLMLALSTSLLNHSCSPNSTIVYDGRNISLQVSENVELGTELTISYINTTLSAKARISELQDRYHFTCHCTQCSRGLTLGHSNINEPMSSTSQQTQLEQKVSALLIEAKSSSAAEGLSQIAEAYQVISYYPEYPAWFSPLYQVRLDLIIALQANKKWVAAFIQSLILHFTAQPVVYPQEAHPARVARGWVHAKMAGHVGGLANEPDFAESLGASDEGELARGLGSNFGLDWGLVVYVLIKEVNDQVLKSHGSGSKFSVHVRQEMLRMKDEAKASRGEPSKEELERTRLALTTVANQGWSWFTMESKNRGSRQLLLTEGPSKQDNGFQKLIK